MRGLLLIAAVAGCGSSGSAPVPDEPAPANVPTTWTIKAGDRLERIAEAAYGSRHYAHAIELVDQVKAEKLEVDQVVALPPLDQLVKDPRVVQAIRRWNAAERAVLEARKAKQPLDEATVAKLRQGSRDALAGAFARGGTRAARELARAATAMRLIARGKADANSYDVDTVDLRLSLAVEDLIQSQ